MCLWVLIPIFYALHVLNACTNITKQSQQPVAPLPGIDLEEGLELGPFIIVLSLS